MEAVQIRRRNKKTPMLHLKYFDEVRVILGSGVRGVKQSRRSRHRRIIPSQSLNPPWGGFIFTLARRPVQSDFIRVALFNDGPCLKAALQKGVNTGCRF